MGYRVILTYSAEPTNGEAREVYPAGATAPGHLTHDRDLARRYHNRLNADIDARKWTLTMALIGIDCKALIERIDH